MVGIQDLLKNPNEKSPAQNDAYQLYTTSIEEYNKKVREYAKDRKSVV